MKDATSPPTRSRVAAIPVPVPRTGAGNDSGVNANMIAYSANFRISLRHRGDVLAALGRLTEVAKYGGSTLESNICRFRTNACVCKQEDTSQHS